MLVGFLFLVYAVCIILRLYYRDKIGQGRVEIGYRKGSERTGGNWVMGGIKNRPCFVDFDFMVRIISVELPEHFLWRLQSYILLSQVQANASRREK